MASDNSLLNGLTSRKMRNESDKGEIIIFKQNDVVCFLGDSITANGRWIAEVFEQVALDGVKLYNCGVSGDSAEKALSRMYQDCLIFSPDYVVVMFGMNDIGRANYLDDNIEEIESALQRYRDSITKIVTRCFAAKIKVILCTPTPYDEVSDVETENLRCNIGLTRCREFLLELAQEYGCKVVDFNGALNQEIGKIHFINDDRVHPNDLGHHMMAQIFMHETGLIQKINFEKQFVMSEHNKDRFAVEGILRGIAFVEWNSLYADKKAARLTMEQKKNLIQKRYDESDLTGYIPDMWKLYLEQVDYKDYFLDELIKMTLTFQGEKQKITT